MGPPEKEVGPSVVNPVEFPCVKVSLACKLARTSWNQLEGPAARVNPMAFG